MRNGPPVYVHERLTRFADNLVVASVNKGVGSACVMFTVLVNPSIQFLVNCLSFHTWTGLSLRRHAGCSRRKRRRKEGSRALGSWHRVCQKK